MKVINKRKNRKYNIEKIILFLLFITWSQNNIWANQNKLSEQIDSIALDSSILYGHLPNGLTYYIKNVKDNSKKLEMRLYVKVGDFYQLPEELEFAHTLEHLAFKCAEDFPFNLLNAPPKFLSNLGIIDEDIQASTWFTTTWYNIKNIPSDSINSIDTGLRWFSNISDLKLTDEAIGSEKGVLRQELIYRNGSDLEGHFLDTRLHSLLNPCYEDKSNFFEHNSDYAPKSLIRFYKKWYRPDRMGLVIVGDISNVYAIEKQIKNHFFNIKEHQHTEEWPDCSLKYLDSPKRFVVLNREQNKIVSDKRVEFFLYQRNRDIILHRQDWKGLQHGLMWNILYKIINRRFKQEVGKTYSTSFSASYYPPQKFSPASEIRIKTTEGQEQEAIGKVIRILKMLKRIGLTSEEWEQVKAEEMISLEPADTKSYYLEHIANHFLYEEILPANKANRLQQWLSQLSVEEFNTLCRERIADMPDDIGIISPIGKSYTEEEIRTWINQALKKDVLQHTIPKVVVQLMNKELSSLHKVGYTDLGTIASGAREFMLDNGVRIVLDTTASNRNSVSIHGFSPKGASCFADKDYFSAINAPRIVKNAGVSHIDKFALDHFLEKTGVWQGTGPYIDYGETGIRGNSTIEDLEYMLQLVYLYFTNPRKNMEAFEDWQQNETERHLNPAYSIISEDFNVLIKQFLGETTETPQGTKRLQGTTKTDMDTAYKIYRKLFGNASDFTFLLNGGFSIDEVLPLLQKYLGNLPNGSYELSCSPIQDMTYSLPKGPFYKEFYAREMDASYTMHSIRYSLRYIAKTEDVLDWKDQIKLIVLGDYMNSKIKELRTSHGAALYNMRAFTFFQKELMNYELRMSMDCLPQELEMLRKLCKEMIEEFKGGIFNQGQIEMVLNHGNFKIPQSTNYNYYRYKEPLVNTTDVQRYVKSLTPRDIQKAAQRYLKDENLMEFVFRDSIVNP